MKEKSKKEPDFTQMLSPMAWFWAHVFVFFSLFVLFQPSLKAFITLLVVDYTAMLLAMYLERWSFLKRFPNAKAYFPKPNEKCVSKLTESEVITFLTEIVDLPRKRAIHLTVMSFIKVIPAGLVTIFVFKHQCSNFQRFLEYTAMELVVQSYLYGVIYIDLHTLVSKRIAEFHAKYDWTSAFTKVKYADSNANLTQHEDISLIATGAGLIVFVYVIISSPESRTDSWLVWKVSSVGLLGMILIGQTYVVNRKYFLGALRHVFEYVGSPDYLVRKQAISLHSTAILATFEKTFNALAVRLRAKELEVSQWVIHETEQSRFRTLGEISGLIVHDLSSPLHVIQFCALEIAENPKLAENPAYLELINTNTRAAVNLVSSLRAYLKNSQNENQESCVKNVHEYVIRLLKTQFRSSGINGISITIDDSLDSAILNITQNNLIHIFYNLYKNGVENLISNNKTQGQIYVSFLNSNGQNISIFIQDNGTGLSNDLFEKMTAKDFFSFKKSDVRSGLGLRLTRNLVERFDGTLTVDSTFSVEHGTRFILTLPGRFLEPQIDSSFATEANIGL